MTAELAIDPAGGAICIGDRLRLVALQEKSNIEALASQWLGGSRDLLNGYEWPPLRGLTFGKQPAGFRCAFTSGNWSAPIGGSPCRAEA